MSERGSSAASTTLVARALFVFHSTLFCWWAFEQLYYRVIIRFVPGDPRLVLDGVNLALITTSLVLTVRFARARRGSAAQTVLTAAVLFAAIDVVCEALQYAPRLGLPGLMPSDKSQTELLVRGFWVSSEFCLRSAMFVALWRSQTGAPQRLPLLFAGLIGTQWALSLLGLAAYTAPFAGSWSQPSAVALALKHAPWLSYTWLTILIWLSRRVARLSAQP